MRYLIAVTVGAVVGLIALANRFGDEEEVPEDPSHPNPTDHQIWYRTGVLDWLPTDR